MRDEAPLWIYPVAVICAMLSLRFGLWLGEIGTERSFQEQAVKAGVAYWANSAEGKPVFKYKEAKEIK